MKITPAPHFDGPRLLLPEEGPASQRLFEAAFGHSSTALEADGETMTLPDDSVLEESELPGEVYAITAGGVPVSQIAIFHSRLEMAGGLLRVGSIGGVGTHPDYRGLGLATRLLEHCARRLRAGGARLMLISGERGLYTRTGNVQAGKYVEFTLLPGRPPSGGAPLRLRPAREADAPLCSRLYQAEPVHFERPVTKFGAHFGQPPGSISGEKWIIERDGLPEAYLLLRLPWEILGHPEAGLRKVHEYAGSREALSGALLQALDEFHLREMECTIPGQDAELIRRLEESGCPMRWTTLPEHTMRILDLPGLLDDLHPAFQERVDSATLNELIAEQRGPLLAGSGADRCTLRLGEEWLELDTAAMTRLVMGSPNPTHEGQTAATGRLAEAIAALFPLPSFLPGLDYH